MKSLRSASGTVSSSGDNSIIAAVSTGRIKVQSYGIFTTSTTAVVATFKNGTGTNDVLWAIPLQALTGSISGAVQSAAGDNFLFATRAKNVALNLNLSSAQTVYWNITYWDDESI